MKIKRKYEDVEITFNITDDEIIELISNKSVDERIVFFRKLFQTDVKNILTLKFLKEFL
jgi:hypothetical protein